MPDDNNPTNPTISDLSSQGAVSDSTSSTNPTPMDTNPNQQASAGDAATEPTPSMPIPSIPIPPVPEPTNQDKASVGTDPDDVIRTEVVSKMGAAKNVLIALSSDPSVDEMATAIGLSLYLDKLGKRATAIYSGATPNALEFLKPEDTFEPSADTLQDFVIAISKDKADHLRYKLDGDYVKIYVTPYRTRLSENDLEYSYGDYNVDLVLALDVANGIDLDSALREHGRIMHDAVIINITTGNPGKFGEIEWSDKSASSVAEMIAKLLYDYGGENKLSKDEATAFLTGIVAATNRFSNAKTTPVTMKVSSKLMESGANQQLVSKNITPDIDNEMFGALGNKNTSLSHDSDHDSDSEATPESESSQNDPTSFDIEHGPKSSEKESSSDSDTTNSDDSSTTTDESESSKEQPEQPETTPDSPSESQPAPSDDSSPEPNSNVEPTTEEHDLLDDLKAAEQNLTNAGAETVPSVEQKAIDVNDIASREPVAAPTVSAPVAAPNEAPSPTPQVAMPTTEFTLPNPTLGIINEPEKVVTPNADFDAEATDESANKYGKMLQDALDGLGSPTEANATISSTPDDMFNPATANAPSAPTNPEINGVPEMNYAPIPTESILPPPPAPPIGMNQPTSPMPLPQSSPDVSVQPPLDSIPPSPQSNDPGAFKIPGM